MDTGSPSVISRLVACGLWLLVLAVVVYAIGGATGAFWGVVPAGFVWAISLRRVALGAQERAYGVLWFIASFFGPLSLVLLAVVLSQCRTRRTLLEQRR
jgi:hypothetical protein